MNDHSEFRDVAESFATRMQKLLGIDMEQAFFFSFISSLCSTESHAPPDLSRAGADLIACLTHP